MDCLDTKIQNMTSDLSLKEIDAMKYLISIIVPIHNVEKYVSQCIDSILKQTYKNLEIILIDDGSTDASGRICDQYKKMDPRIQVIHKTNSGVSDSRNYGLDIAKGDFVGFVDSDDWIEHDMYENLLKLCMKHRVKLACTGYVETENNDIQITASDKKELLLPCDDLLKYMIIGNGPMNVSNAVWSRLYRRDIIKDIRFPKSVSYGEEIVFNTKVLFNAEKCIYTDERLYHYRIRVGSITRSEKGNIFSSKTATNLMNIYKELLSLGHTIGSEFDP